MIKLLNTDYSVLMAVYSKEDSQYFQDSIKSILEQTASTNDFVIVCDGELTKKLDEVLDNYVKQYSEIFHIIRLKRNVGLTEALNAGLKFCKNELVARMDSDDIAVSDRCEKQIKIFNQLDVDIVGGAVCEFFNTPGDSSIKRSPPEKHEEITSFAKQRNPFNHPCVMFKKSAVDAVGGYNSFTWFEDYDLWIRMLMQGSIGYNVQQTLLYMRSGDGLYARRGGKAYCKALLRFRLQAYRYGYINLWQFLNVSVGHCFFALLPTSLRQLFYKKYLRN